MKVNLRIFKNVSKPMLGLSVSVFGFWMSNASAQEPSSDLDRLLSTGSCHHCSIENVDLRGRSLKWDDITNTGFKNVNFSSASISVNHLERVSFDKSSFDRASVALGQVSQVRFSQVSMIGSSFSAKSLVDSTIDHINWSNSSLSVSYLRRVLIDNFISRSAKLSVSDGDQLEMNIGQMNGTNVFYRGGSASMESIEAPQSAWTFFKTDDSRIGFAQSKMINSRFVTGRVDLLDFDAYTDISGSTLNNRTCRSGSIGGCN